MAQDDGISAIKDAISQRLTVIDEQLQSVQSLLDEREKLQRALQDLDEEAPGRSRARRHTAAATPQRVRRSSTGSGRAARGANREAVLDFVDDHPGASAADVVSATGIKRGVAYNLLTRLVAQGALDREPGEDGNARYSVAHA